MNILSSPISGLMIVEQTARIDTRGAFTRFFCEKELSQIFDKRRVVQINHSLSINIGTIRGLHFQNPPNAEMKLIRCIKGKVWDVAVDLRKNSPTFLKWHAEELSPSNARMMVIPEGFAHGFQVLEENSELIYLHSEFYTLNSENAIRFDDPRVAIKWPLKVTEISERDTKHPHIDLCFEGLII